MTDEEKALAFERVLKRVHESYQGCECTCVEAYRDENGYWTPKHTCLPCEVRYVLADSVTRTTGWCASLDYGEPPPR